MYFFWGGGERGLAVCWAIPSRVANRAKSPCNLDISSRSGDHRPGAKRSPPQNERGKKTHRETDPTSFLREQFFKRSRKNNYTFPSLDLLGTQKKKMCGSVEITGQKRGKRKKLGSSRFLQRSQIWNLTYLRGQQWADCPSF